jgi:hypothetical protein
MKRQLLLALMILVAVLPLSYGTACQAGCSSCQYEASDCPTCTRFDYLYNWSINPCNSRNLNFSTPVSVSIAGGSYYISESGMFNYYYCQNISVRAIMYYGTAYEQDSGWTATDVSFVPHLLNFTANHSGVATLKMMVKYDSGADWDIKLQNMTIASNTSIGNIYYGDCKLNSYTSEIEEAENPIAITFGIMPYWGASILYTLFMIICIGLAWYGMSQVKSFGSIKIAVCLLLLIFLMIIGAAAKVIGFEYLFIIFIGFAVYIGIQIRKVIA